MIRRTVENGARSRLLLLMFILVGVMTMQQPADAASNESLRERVIQYWEGRMKGNLLAAYQLHEPAFRRAVTFAAFSQGRGVTPILAYDILDERIDGDMAWVKVNKKYTVKHPMLVKPVEPRWSETEEQWVRVEGVWYRKFRFPMGDPYPAVDWEAIATERDREGRP